HDDAVAERDLADVGARTAVDAEAVAAFPHDLHGTAGGAGLLAEEGREAGGMGAPDGHAGAQPGTRELRTVLVGDDPALVEGDHVVPDPGRFLGVGGGAEDGAALVGVGAG